MKRLTSKDFGKVAVLMGGWSAERPVSLQSGQAVLAALLSKHVDAHAVDVDRNIALKLQSEGYDRAINLLHGTGGEDGVIQGLLESIGLPYTGSGVKASALSMDKVLTKRVWRSAGFSTPDFMRLTEASDPEAVEQALGMPLIVKPVSEGSSIGMAKVDRLDGLMDAWAGAAGSDGEVFVEQWIEGEEYTVAIIDGQALPAIRLETPHIFYDYSAKYESNNTSYYCPCGLSPVEEGALQKLALAAFHVLDASGWGRVDFMRDASGKFWLIELNTVPGMTGHSLVPKAAAAAGIDFPSLAWKILATSFHEVRSHGAAAA